MKPRQITLVVLVVLIILAFFILLKRPVEAPATTHDQDITSAIAFAKGSWLNSDPNIIF